MPLTKETHWTPRFRYPFSDNTSRVFAVPLGSSEQIEVPAGGRQRSEDQDGLGDGGVDEVCGSRRNIFLKARAVRAPV